MRLAPIPMPARYPGRRARETSAEQARSQRALVYLGTDELDAVRGRPGAGGHDLGQRGAREAESDSVVGGVAGREAAGHEPVVGRPPLLLAVVVRAGRTREEAEAVEPVERGAER